MKKSKLYAAFVATVVFSVVQAPAQVTKRYERDSPCLGGNDQIRQFGDRSKRR
jgi:hypothetical protein